MTLNTDPKEPSDLENLLVKAEIRKVLSEKNKIELERLKLALDYEIAKKDSQKKWWRKEKFWQLIASAILGSSILGFYITYVVVPTASLNNLKLEIENEKKEMRLVQKEKQLQQDSIKFKKISLENDSIRYSLDLREHKLVEAELKIKRLDSAYKEALKDSKISQEKLAALEKLRKNLTASISKMESESDKISCTFSVLGINGSILKENLSISFDNEAAMSGLFYDYKGRPFTIFLYPGIYHVYIYQGDKVISTTKIQITPSLEPLKISLYAK